MCNLFNLIYLYGTTYLNKKLCLKKFSLSVRNVKLKKLVKNIILGNEEPREDQQ